MIHIPFKSQKSVIKDTRGPLQLKDRLRKHCVMRILFVCYVHFFAMTKLIHKSYAQSLNEEKWSNQNSHETNPEQLLQTAEELFQKGIYSDAAEYYWTSFMMGSQSNQRKDRFSPEKIQYIAQQFLLAKHKDNSLADGFFQFAKSYKNTNRDYQNAIKYIEKTLEVDPSHKSASKMLADIELEQDRLRQQKQMENSMNEEDHHPSNNFVRPESCVSESNCQQFFQKYLYSGWDENANTFYQNTKEALHFKEAIEVNYKRVSDTYHGPKLDSVNVADDNFWTYGFHQGMNWERDTFGIFDKYITQDTIVVDFGSWIGPTVLYSGQFAKKTYAIEADPVAYATLEYNVGLNHEYEWSSQIHIESICISQPSDAGFMKMQSNTAGNSCSLIGDNVIEACGLVEHEWKVYCYTLPYVFAHWNIRLSPEQPIFIKMDIESYEYDLLPSLYDWLIEVESSARPTIFVSFHPQLRECPKEQLKLILRVFKLFRKVSCHGDKRPLLITNLTAFEEFENMLLVNECLFSSTYSDFVVSNR